MNVTSPTMAATSATVIAPAVSLGASYTDNFNRSNNASLGASWTAYDIGTTTYFRILSNECAAPSSLPLGYGLCLSEYNTAVTSNNHKVSITVGATKPSSVLLVLRSNGTDYVWAQCPDGAPWSINYTSGEATPYQGVNSIEGNATVGSETFTAGDVLAVEASGDVYTIKRNGSTVLTWTDSGGDFTPYVDSSHRKTAIGALVLTTADSLDNFLAGDI